MKNKLYIFITLILSVVFASCDDLFSPLEENVRNKDVMYKEAAFAEGLIAYAYAQIPANGLSFNDVATDNAVSNDFGNNWLKMSTGQWTSSSWESTNLWNKCYSTILYLNTIIEESDYVNWAADEDARLLFTLRMKGEAYGLRALFMYHLLQAYSGYSDGQLLGIPLVITQQDKNSDLNIPRASFKASVEQIYADIEKAEQLLPSSYDDLSDTDRIPSKYIDYGVSSDTLIATYNRTLGTKFRGRMNSLIAKAVKSQVALLAASPAFLDGSDNSWADAAEFSYEVLKFNGGLSGIASNGVAWYANQGETDALSEGANPPEILWRSSVGADNSIESNNYPPSLRGNGRCNPTQNLVDAFPAVNGYPIEHESSGYDKNNPYANRDPRLKKYILYNQSNFGPSSAVINITSGSGSDVMNKETGKSTRTGYYLRKFMKESTNLDPNNSKSNNHYYARIRYTELYLIFAEAANEAYGPEGKPAGIDFSAYDVIAQLRQRAGISSNDAYLESIKGNKIAMRELIRNERRLELCFEGHRFWDLRRWKEDLNEPARGIKIDNGMVDLGSDGKGVIVEKREYKNYMYYGPIPLSETLKFDNLSQNAGW